MNRVYFPMQLIMIRNERQRRERKEQRRREGPIKLGLGWDPGGLGFFLVLLPFNHEFRVPSGPVDFLMSCKG